MASSDRPAIERLTPTDLPDCLALSRGAHWNQVEADWRLFFDRGSVWGIRLEGRVVASAALLPYPPKTAWIAMVLTAQAARGRGFARHLTTAALEDCDRRGLVAQLDATPEGERVYSKLGFHTLAGLTRWRRPGSAAPDPHTERDKVSPEVFANICRQDESALGFARPDLLRWLRARGPASVLEDAFALSRDGRSAHQIGPVAASRWASAESILTTLHDRLGADAPIIVDACDAAADLSAFLQGQGYRPERPFLRMVKGTAPPLDRTQYLASAGPELG